MDHTLSINNRFSVPSFYIAVAPESLLNYAACHDLALLMSSVVLVLNVVLVMILVVVRSYSFRILLIFSTNLKNAF